MKHFHISKAPPRIASEGFVPAGTGGRVKRRDMLIPKPRHRWQERKTALLEKDLSHLAARLGPGDRRALREIVETGELVTEGKHTYLVARVSSATVDALASFEAEGEDFELELEDDYADDEPDHDNEPDHDHEPDHDNKPSNC